MRKRLLSMLLTICMMLTLLPVTAAVATTLEVGGVSYALTETGLNNAIADASNGDTIKFIASGTIALTANININKSVTLDMNGQTINFTSGSYYVNISPSVSVTIQGPGTITMDRFMQISNGSTLTVNGNTIIEGTGVWQPLINFGTLSMAGGTLKQTGTGYALQNSGAATFDNATIEGKPANSAVIWAANSSTLTLNNCTTRNIYSGTGSWAITGSIIYITHTSTVNLIGGSFTGPEGSTAPAIHVASGTTFTNNGATITNGIVRKLGDLTVSVSSGTGKVTLASQTPETGVTYYYKSTATDDTAAKPAPYGSAAFAPEGWTAFSAATDIPTTVTAAVYVQAVKVGDSEQKIYGWGQGSAVPLPIMTYTISGTIRGSDTLSGIAATVQLKNSSNANVGSPVTAGADGNYTISEVPAGTGYTIAVSCIGYDSSTITSFDVSDTNITGKDSTLTNIFSEAPPTIYTVTFDANGGTRTGGGELTQTVESGASAIAPTLTRSGYTFNSWDKTLTNITETQTITAQWTRNITGGGGGGTSSSDNSSTVTVTPPAPDKPDSPTQGEIKVPGTVDNKGNVTVNITDKTMKDAFEKALEGARKNGNEQNGITLVLRVDTGGKTGSNVAVNLPKTVQNTIIAKKIVNTVVVVDNPDIRVGMDLATVQEINKQANSDVNITATRTDDDKLTGEAKKAIGSRPVFDLKVNYGSGQQVQSFGTGSVSVAIPYTLSANEKAGNVQAVYLDSNGKVHWLANSVYDSVEKVLRFSTNHFSTYGVGYKQANMEFTTSFTDIASHWAKGNIEFVVSRGLFSGTSATTFSPNTSVTRGMFVTVLGRLANADASGYKQSSFIDVKSDAYYTNYIEWASNNSIAKGTGNGQFAPDQSITREQMAVFMQNYAKVKGFTLPKIHGENTFADNANISAYAKDAVKQMQMAGVLSGKSGNLFDPKGTATRAEVSTVLRRFVELATSSDTM